MKFFNPVLSAIIVCVSVYVCWGEITNATIGSEKDPVTNVRNATIGSENDPVTNTANETILEESTNSTDENPAPCWFPFMREGYKTDDSVLPDDYMNDFPNITADETPSYDGDEYVQPLAETPLS
uniref:Secreted protein n=1 Tax=Rhabditophanes sp. KR3021 TaxID=114890 RepID=A0AC35TR39_9BILA